MSQREFKFRIWNGHNMVNPKNTTMLALDPSIKIDGVFIPFMPDWPIMQYTGIKDCEGKELYEGDVYQRYAYFYLIIWDNESSGFKSKVIASESFDGIKKDSDEKGRLFNIPSNSLTTLVGNIYENPELLK